MRAVLVVVLVIVIIFWINSKSIQIFLLFWVGEGIAIMIEMKFHTNPETCGLHVSIKLI